MTARIINLRQARKARARAVADGVAAGNRARFGRTKARKTADLREAERLAGAIDGAKLGD